MSEGPDEGPEFTPPDIEAAIASIRKGFADALAPMQRALNREQAIEDIRRENAQLRALLGMDDITPPPDPRDARKALLRKARAIALHHLTTRAAVRTIFVEWKNHVRPRIAPAEGTLAFYLDQLREAGIAPVSESTINRDIDPAYDTK
jgi:hypothetical protein